MQNDLSRVYATLSSGGQMGGGGLRVIYDLLEGQKEWSVPRP